MKYFSKIIYPTLITTLGFSILAAPTFAQDTPPTLLGAFGKVPVLINIFIAVAAVAFFFMLIVSGYLFMTATGDKKKIDNAKKSLFFSVVGFALIFLPFLAFPLIGRVAGVKTGFLTDPGNGNISINLGSTFTPTPLPTTIINTATPTPAVFNDDYQDVSLTTSRNGCTIGVVAGGVPVFFQYMATNHDGNAPSMPGGPTYECDLYGEYDGSTGIVDICRPPDDESCKIINRKLNVAEKEAFAWEGAACSAASITTVVDAWLNLSGQNGNLILSDGINALLHYNAITNHGGYSPPSDAGPYGRFTPMVNAANYMAAQAGKAIQFNASIISGSPSDMTNFNNMVNIANSGVPVIFRGDNHYMVLLKVDGDTAYVADPGRVTYFNLHGSYVKSGIQKLSVNALKGFWVGDAVILRPA